VSERNVEVVKGIYDAINQAYATGDYSEPIERFCHPDVVLKTSGMFPESGDDEGYEGLREFAENQAEAFETMFVQTADFTDVGDQVITPPRSGGIARHTGIEATFSVVHVWTLRDCRVSRLDVYRSREEALKAVGLEE
jgi:ketosteroid isomerase-like protein